MYCIVTALCFIVQYFIEMLHNPSPPTLLLSARCLPVCATLQNFCAESRQTVSMRNAPPLPPTRSSSPQPCLLRWHSASPLPPRARARRLPACPPARPPILPLFHRTRLFSAPSLAPLSCPHPSRHHRHRRARHRLQCTAHSKFLGPATKVVKKTTNFHPRRFFTSSSSAKSTISAIRKSASAFLTTIMNGGESYTTNDLLGVPEYFSTYAQEAFTECGNISKESKVRRSGPSQKSVATQESHLRRKRKYIRGQTKAAASTPLQLLKRNCHFQITPPVWRGGPARRTVVLTPTVVGVDAIGKAGKNVRVPGFTASTTLVNQAAVGVASPSNIRTTASAVVNEMVYNVKSHAAWFLLPVAWMTGFHWSDIQQSLLSGLITSAAAVATLAGACLDTTSNNLHPANTSDVIWIE